MTCICQTADPSFVCDNHHSTELRIHSRIVYKPIDSTIVPFNLNEGQSTCHSLMSRIYYCAILSRHFLSHNSIGISRKKGINIDSRIYQETFKRVFCFCDKKYIFVITARVFLASRQFRIVRHSERYMRYLASSVKIFLLAISSILRFLYLRPWNQKDSGEKNDLKWETTNTSWFPEHSVTLERG